MKAKALIAHGAVTLRISRLARLPSSWDFVCHGLCFVVVVIRVSVVHVQARP